MTVCIQGISSLREGTGAANSPAEGDTGLLVVVPSVCRKRVVALLWRRVAGLRSFEAQEDTFLELERTGACTRLAMADMLAHHNSEGDSRIGVGVLVSQIRKVEGPRSLVELLTLLLGARMALQWSQTVARFDTLP